MSSVYICTVFYLNRNYISENICVNRFDKIPTCKGQCYLSKKLNENEKQERKFPDLKQKEIQLFCEENELFNSKSLPLVEVDIFRGYNADLYISNYAASVFRPPQTA